MRVHVLMLTAEDVVDGQVRLCFVSGDLTRRKDCLEVLRELACSLSLLTFILF